jgi:hypothetical protein
MYKGFKINIAKRFFKNTKVFWKNDFSFVFVRKIILLRKCNCVLRELLVIISLFSVQTNQRPIYLKIPLYFLIKNNFFI